MLDLVDKTLHQMPLLVQMGIISRVRPLGPGRNDHIGFILLDEQADELIGIIRFVGNQALEIQIKDQRFGLGDVVPLPGRNDEPQRIAQTVYADVELGTEATSTAAQGLFGLTAFFLTPRPHTDVPGRWCYQGSGVPYPGHRQNVGASAPKYRGRSGGQSVCRRYSSARTSWAASATGHHSGRSRGHLRQNDGTDFPDQRKRVDRLVRT